MKVSKLALIGLCCASVGSAYAGSCGEQSIPLRGTQMYDDNEFLYPSDTKWLEKSGYECDDEACGAGKTITMFPGHYFQGEKIDETRTYKCKTGVLDDRWEIESKSISGDIVVERWCDSITASKAHSYYSDYRIFSDTMDGFDSIKKMLSGDDREYAREIYAKCTQNGWDNVQVYDCISPYIPCEGHCVYYKDLLDKAVKNGMSHKDLAKYLGAPESDYEDFAAGKMTGSLLNDFVNASRDWILVYSECKYK